MQDLHKKCSSCVDATNVCCTACVAPYVLIDGVCSSCEECQALRGHYCDREMNACITCDS